MAAPVRVRVEEYDCVALLRLDAQYLRAAAELQAQLCMLHPDVRALLTQLLVALFALLPFLEELAGDVLLHLAIEGEGWERRLAAERRVLQEHQRGHHVVTREGLVVRAPEAPNPVLDDLQHL